MGIFTITYLIVVACTSIKLSSYNTSLPIGFVTVSTITAQYAAVALHHTLCMLNINSIIALKVFIL